MANYAILIKTNSYAGNFEREMCAHVTGHIGECGVGDEYVDELLAQKFEDYIGLESEDDDCYRPAALGYDLGYSNNDVVIWFNKKPTQELIDTIKERLETFNETRKELQTWDNDAIEVKGISLLDIRRTTKITEEII
jgi:hypothetical protein